MKLAIVLIIIGGVLILEGITRVYIAGGNGDMWVVLGGIVTGILLGSYVLYKGINRFKKTKSKVNL